MTATWAVVAFIWRRLRRDRLGLAFSFLLPVAVAVVMAGIYAADYSEVGLVVEDGAGEVGRELSARLEDNGVAGVRRFDDRESLDRAVRRREVSAGVVVPAGVAVAAAPAPVRLVGPPGIEAPSGVRAVVEVAVAETAAAHDLGRAIEPGAAPGPAVVAGAAALGDRPMDGDGGGAEDGRTEAVGEALVGTLVLFVFVNTIGGSFTLVQARELGVLARARTTPASLAAVGLGFGVAWTSYALVEAALVVGTGALLFGTAWSSWPALVVVVVVVAVVAGAATMVTATLLPSSEMATTVAGPVAFVLGMLGGALWPLEIVGPALQVVGHLTPHAWAIEAIRATGVYGDGLMDVAAPLGVLTAGAAALAAVGGWRLRRLSDGT